jgi:hypothetical protein
MGYTYEGRMPDPQEIAPPDLDTQKLDDSNFNTTDLSQAWGIWGRARFLIKREYKDREGYYVEDGAKNILGRIGMVQNGGWAVESPNGNVLAMLWRQHSEDHHVDNISSLIHMGFHRWENARKDEVTATLYCLANLDKTVRLFITLVEKEATLESPSNRLVLKMAPGKQHNELVFADGFDDPVATIRTEAMSSAETHEITFIEAEDPFLAAIFTVALGLESSLRHGGVWKSPY